ncbi:hypothetical protein ONE63_011481 [Megalurothrips usitatus]|uniref:Regulatory protein zeste n=1 Tax=Megalurothrips usitatus TaxID=439358 RepID=A0AAV7X4G5_9NEOP|nr:hypothetical protein ONE63_011481 [Megalurothrips usitatus]
MTVTEVRRSCRNIYGKEWLSQQYPLSNRVNGFSGSDIYKHEALSAIGTIMLSAMEAMPRALWDFSLRALGNGAPKLTCIWMLLEGVTEMPWDPQYYQNYDFNWELDRMAHSWTVIVLRHKIKNLVLIFQGAVIILTLIWWDWINYVIAQIIQSVMQQHFPKHFSVVKKTCDSDSLSDDFVQPRKEPPPQDNCQASRSVSPKPKAKLSFSCKFCSALFTNKSNRNRHEGHCVAATQSQSPRFSCSRCNAAFKRTDHLNAHSKKCSSQTTPVISKKKNPCLIGECDEEFYHKGSLIQHLKSAHHQDVTIKPVVYKTFSSIKEFNAWKEKEEQDTYSYFTSRKGQASRRTKYFYCQHDGSGKQHSKRKTSRCNSRGRIKVGHVCIAKMTVRIESEAVYLEYCPTHSHACKKEDIYHHPLPEAMSRFIDEKLAENIPATVVYELTKDRFLPKNSAHIDNTKANILTKKRVLERGRRKRMARRLHKDDAKAVFLLASQLIQKDDSVLIYKPYGSELATKNRVSLEQRDVMLRFMKNHPALGTNKFTAPDGVKHKARLLNELTEQLNSCPSGATKASDKWLKAWQDWRSDVKSKAAKIKRHANGTGGGPALKVSLTPMEEELLAYLGDAAVSGHAVIDILDVPLETTYVEATPILCDPFQPEGAECVSAQEAVPISTTVSSPSPTESSTESCSSAPSSARKRRRTLTRSTESVSDDDSKLISLASQQLAVQTEQLNVSKRNMDIAELQLALSRDMYDLQKEQGNRYGAALEKLADSMQLAAVAFASYFKKD